MAQLKEQGRALSYAALEAFRLMQNGCEYDRLLLPSRAQVQNVHHQLSVGGESMITHPRYSAQHDFVDLDSQVILEHVLDRLNWPGVSPEKIAGAPAAVAELPPFCIDIGTHSYSGDSCFINLQKSGCVYSAFS